MQGDFYMKENKIRKRLVLFMTAAAVMSFIVVMVLACRSARVTKKPKGVIWTKA